MEWAIPSNLWTWWANVTVAGQGMGEPSYLPARSFEPILLRRSQTMGFYLATDGPWLLASKGETEGKPHAANTDLVVYQGFGKRRPIAAGTIAPQKFNGAFGYYRVDIPTPSLTIACGTCSCGAPPSRWCGTPMSRRVSGKRRSGGRRS